MTLYLYHITQDIVIGWDTFSDAVVAAKDEDDARTIHPRTVWWGTQKEGVIRITDVDDDARIYKDWPTDPEQIQVKLIGVAVEEIQAPCAICASFHAG